MGIGVSLILIAVGAVLAFAVHVTTTGFNVNTVGYILLVVGAIGALISLVFWSSWGGIRRSRAGAQDRRRGRGSLEPAGGVAVGPRFAGPADAALPSRH